MHRYRSEVAKGQERWAKWRTENPVALGTRAVDDHSKPEYWKRNPQNLKVELVHGPDFHLIRDCYFVIPGDRGVSHNDPGSREPSTFPYSLGVVPPDEWAP